MTADGATGNGVPHADDASVVVYSRRGCHLCEQALAVVTEVCADLAVDWVEIDIDAPEHPELRRMFGDEVPVTFVDGRQHDFWQVDRVRLRQALAGRDEPAG